MPADLRVMPVALFLLLLGGHWLPAQDSTDPSADQSAAASSSAEAAEREQQIAERDRLWQQAQTLAGEGKTAEAIEIGEQVLALERELFGQTHAELTGTLPWLSSRYLEQQEMQRAEERAVELLRVQTALHGKDGWQTVSARWYLDYVRKLAAVEPETLAEMLAIDAEFNRLSAAEKYAEAAAKAQELVPLEAAALGSDHPFFANTFANRADCLLNAGEFPAAETAARRALEIRRQQLGNLHPETATAAWFLALSRIRQQNHSAALEPLNVARDTWRATGQNVDAAWMDSHRGDALAALGRESNAQAAYTAAADAFRRLKNDEAFALSTNKVAQCLYRQNNYVDAVEYFDAARGSFERVGQPANAAWMLNWIGDCHRNGNDDTAAVEAYSASAAKFADLGKDEGVAVNEQSIAEVLFDHERFVEAIQHFELAFDAYTECNKPLDAAAMRHWTGDCYRERGDDKAAVMAYSKSTDVCADLNHSEGLARGERELAKAMVRLNRADEAVSHFKTAAKAFAAIMQFDQAAEALWERASLLRKLGSFDESLRALDEVIEYDAKTGNHDGAAYLVKAQILRDTTRWNAAVAEFQTALKHFRLNNNHLGIGQAAFDLGLLLMRQQEYREAAKRYEEAETAFKAGGNESQSAFMLVWKTECLANLSNHTRAVEVLLKAERRFRAIENRDGLAAVAERLAREYAALGRTEDSAQQSRAAVSHYEHVREAYLSSRNYDAYLTAVASAAASNWCPMKG